MTLLPHIAGRLFSSPLMITPEKLEVIMGVLTPRLQGEALPFKGNFETAQDYQITSNGIAIIPIVGTLVRRSLGLEAASGLSSYAVLSHQIATATTSPSVHGILLEVDSPGGEAGGIFDLADQIYAARKIKPVWAVVNEEAFSAAYALAASAEKIYVSRTGGVGSIGVIAVHLDQSQADSDEGLKYTSVYAGEHKDDYSPHAPLTDPARLSLQKEVNRVYEMFVQTVARGRSISSDAICKTEAALFFGENGLTAGLADCLGTFENAIDDLGVSLSSPSIPLYRKEQLMSKQDKNTHIEANNEAPDMEALKAEMLEKARNEAMTYVAEIHDLCALAGMPHMATNFIAKSASIKMVRHELLEARATASERQEINGHIPDSAPATESKIDTAAIYAKRNNPKGE